MSYSYLASPYSHADSAVRQLRYEQDRQVTAKLMEMLKWVVFSPIVHCHDLAIHHSLPYDFAFWERYNKAMLFPAERLVVLAIDGWRESKGVRGEIKYAAQLNMQMRIVVPTPQGDDYKMEPWDSDEFLATPLDTP